jgi:hypothetical protein
MEWVFLILYWLVALVGWGTIFYDLTRPSPPDTR